MPEWLFISYSEKATPNIRSPIYKGYFVSPKYFIASFLTFTQNSQNHCSSCKGENITYGTNQPPAPMVSNRRVLPMITIYCWM